MLPSGLRNTPLAGVVVAVETNPALLSEYYGRKTWEWKAEKDVDQILEFLDRWESFAWEGMVPRDLVWFSIEHETVDLGGRLKELCCRGLSTIHLCHWGPNQYFTPDAGVTVAGEALLQEMADHEILVDLTHIPVCAMKSVLAKCPARKILSHVVCEDGLERSIIRRSNAFSATMLEECDAELYGIPFIDDIVSLVAREKPQERISTAKIIVKHLQRMAEIVGWERVALGPDYFSPSIARISLGYEVGTVVGMDSVAGLEELETGLEKLGWNNDAIEGVFWRNALRVFGRHPKIF